MNAYRMQDAIEDKRQAEHEAKLDRDDWISRRADQLTTQWPKTMNEFKSPFLMMPAFYSAMQSEMATEAYEALIWAICEAQAVSDWNEAWMLGEVA